MQGNLLRNVPRREICGQKSHEVVRGTLARKGEPDGRFDKPAWGGSIENWCEERLLAMSRMVSMWSPAETTAETVGGR